MRTNSEKRNSKPIQESWKSGDSGRESDGSSTESEKYRCRHPQECYKCHPVGHIARYCPSTALVESAAPTETAAVTTMTSIENYWKTVTNGESPSNESWYLDCATNTHICGGQQKFEQYTECSNRAERQIRDSAGRVTGKAIGHGDVQLRIPLPRGHRNQVIVRNILYVE